MLTNSTILVVGYYFHDQRNRKKFKTIIKGKLREEIGENRDVI